MTPADIERLRAFHQRMRGIRFRSAEHLLDDMDELGAEFAEMVRALFGLNFARSDRAAHPLPLDRARGRQQVYRSTEVIAGRMVRVTRQRTRAGYGL